MADTKCSQIRDINGYVTSTLAGVSFPKQGQYFTLTQGTVTTVTVPGAPGLPNDQYAAYFTYSAGADVFVQLGSSPTLTAPNGTVTATTAELLPGIRLVKPGQTIQFLYQNAQTGVATVSVSISYRAISPNNFLG